MLNASFERRPHSLKQTPQPTITSGALTIYIYILYDLLCATFDIVSNAIGPLRRLNTMKGHICNLKPRPFVHL